MHRNLHDLQLWFRRALERGGAEDLSVISQGVIPRSRADRLDVYVYAFWARQIESIADDFPEVVRLIEAKLGTEEFQNISRDYLKGLPLLSPSSANSPTLSRVSAAFAEFLGTHPIRSQLPWIQDLAKLEWASIEARSSKEVSPDPSVWCAVVGALTPEQWLSSRLILSPALKVVQTEWVFDLDPEIMPVPTQAEARVYCVTPGAWQELEPLEGRLFCKIHQGYTIMQALNVIGSELDMNPQALTGWVSAWLDEGWITGVSVGDHDACSDISPTHH